MKTRIQTPETAEATPTGRTALMADAFSSHVSTGHRIAAPPLEWHALLLRYLPEPLSASHSVKRFALR
ncbi:hypothetical protein ACELLULO517_07060 [Acidisoma cellulosilytica]|uniref:Uncharacterized protein n=1 Tax=Acidisoma cellulosilyticum TaxID=2802395 RepID=A0A963YZF4_9PROT|nr:hypothetical protein [Acidisoma cellulosilyticum]MCB8879988.1 hypothetical protein [Acidisoma cellulosilyticum]